MTTRIGVISDTHGLVREEAVEFLRGSDLIVHGGDIGHPDVLSELERIAPVKAVRGNVDRGKWADRLPETEYIEHKGCAIYALHNIGDLDIDPAAAGIQVVVYGHSHRPEKKLRENVVYLNPGSAGPRRFSLPVSLGRLYWHPDSGRVEAEIREIDIRR